MRALLSIALVASCGGVPAARVDAPERAPGRAIAAPAAPLPARCVVTVDPPTPMRLATELAARDLQRDLFDTSGEPLAFRADEGPELRADPRDLRRAYPHANGSANERWTSARRFALDRDRTLRVAGRNDKDYAVVAGGHGILDWLDFATDTASGGARLVGARQGPDGEARLVVVTLDARTTVTAATELETMTPPASVAVTGDGALAMVYLQRGRREENRVLRFASMDATGTVTQRTIAEGAVLDVAVAFDAGAPVIAYATLHSDERTNNEVPLDLAVVRVAHEGETTPLWSQRSKALVWSVAGSAGGILPIELQAASLGEHAVFAWLELGPRDVGLRFGAARGGPTEQRIATEEGWRLLLGAADGHGKLLLLHRQNRAHQVADVRCALW
jgi:hypothetical protein